MYVCEMCMCIVDILLMFEWNEVECNAEGAISCLCIISYVEWYECSCVCTDKKSLNKDKVL